MDRSHDLLTQHEGLLQWVTNKFADRFTQIPRDDLEQTARIALWRAIKRFDENQGNEFSTFGVRVMMNVLRTFVKKWCRWSSAVDASMDDLEVGWYCSQYTDVLEILCARLSPTAFQLVKHAMSGMRKPLGLAKALDVSVDDVRLLRDEVEKELKELGHTPQGV